MVLEIMKPRSVAPNFYSSEKYNYQKIIKSQFILNDNLSQSVIRKAGGKYLAAAALQNLDDAGKWTQLCPPPLLLLLYLFQALYFQNIDLSRFLALHNPSRIGWSTTPRSKILGKDGSFRQIKKLHKERSFLSLGPLSSKLSDVVSPLVLLDSLLLSFKDEETDSQKYEMTYPKLPRSQWGAITLH